MIGILLPFKSVEAKENLSIRILVYDSYQSTYIKGASMTLFNEEGSMISSWISSSKEGDLIEVPNEGIYKIRCEDLPKGYASKGDMDIVVSSNASKPLYKVFVGEYTQVELFVHDEEENPLINQKVAIYSKKNEKIPTKDIHQDKLIKRTNEEGCLEMEIFFDDYVVEIIPDIKEEISYEKKSFSLSSPEEEYWEMTAIKGEYIPIEEVEPIVVEEPIPIYEDIIEKEVIEKVEPIKEEKKVIEVKKEEEKIERPLISRPQEVKEEKEEVEEKVEAKKVTPGFFVQLCDEKGVCLEGARLAIFDEEGKLIERWKSDQKPHLLRGDEILENHTYIIQQESGISGYDMSKTKVQYTLPSGLEEAPILKIINTKIEKEVLPNDEPQTSSWTTLGFIIFFGTISIIGLSLFWAQKHRRKV